MIEMKEGGWLLIWLLINFSDNISDNGRHSDIDIGRQSYIGRQIAGTKQRKNWTRFGNMRDIISASVNLFLYRKYSGYKNYIWEYCV